ATTKRTTVEPPDDSRMNGIFCRIGRHQQEQKEWHLMQNWMTSAGTGVMTSSAELHDISRNRRNGIVCRNG
ncbi:hypothetical protein LSAT2_024615, partial [Lamellibrachia satsuma]